MSNWTEHHPGCSFPWLVSMYINHCMQYLKAAVEGRDPDITQEEFGSTDSEDSAYYGLRELKDMCIRIAGCAPLPWKDWPIRQNSD